MSETRVLYIFGINLRKRKEKLERGIQRFQTCSYIKYDFSNDACVK